MTPMNFFYPGMLVGALALVAAAVVANGEVGNAELRLVEGVRSAVEAIAPARSLALNEITLPVSSRLD